MGIDASGKTIGVSVLQLNDDKTISVVEITYFQPDQKAELLDNLYYIGDNIKKLLYKHKPDKIAIEEIIKFMKNKSTASTTTKLAGVNRMVCYICYEYLKSSNLPGKPLLLNVLKIRHAIKPTKVLPAKEDIPDIIVKKLNITNFPYVLKKSGKNKGSYADPTYDQADSCAVALTNIIIDTSTKKKK